MNKKNEKTLLNWTEVFSPPPAQLNKSFLVLFFQKRTSFLLVLPICAAPRAALNFLTLQAFFPIRQRLQRLCAPARPCAGVIPLRTGFLIVR
jgi:hypothetical protein